VRYGYIAPETSPGVLLIPMTLVTRNKNVFSIKGEVTLIVIETRGQEAGGAVAILALVSMPRPELISVFVSMTRLTGRTFEVELPKGSIGQGIGLFMTGDTGDGQVAPVQGEFGLLMHGQ